MNKTEEQYKYLMIQTKFDIEYYGLYIQSYSMFTRIIDCILLVVSTGALTSLLFKIDTFGHITLIIITIVQIFTSIKDKLPWYSRISDLYKLYFNLTIIYEQLEYNYLFNRNHNIENAYWVNEKAITSLKLNALPFDYLPKNKKFIEKADATTNLYFKTKFGWNFNKK